MLLQAVIFDMDGVLVDSEVYWKALEGPLYRSLGVPYSEAFATAVIGRTPADIAAYIREAYGIAMTGETLYAAYDSIAERVYEKAQPLQGVTSLLQALVAQEIPLAIGSSSSDRWIELCLEKSGLKQFFTHTYSSTSLGLAGKPDPALYLRIIQDLGVDAARTVICEDSQPGFQAAKASGAVPVAIADPRWCTGPYPGAALIAPSFADVDVHTLTALLSSTGDAPLTS